MHARKIIFLKYCSKQQSQTRCTVAARTSQSRLNGRAKTSSAPHTGRVSAELAAQLEELTQELVDTRLSIEGLEKERDFYFGKLRDIEVGEYIQCPQKILYTRRITFARLSFKSRRRAATRWPPRSWRFCTPRRRGSPCRRTRRRWPTTTFSRPKGYSYGNKVVQE